MAETNLGRVAIVPKGTYSASVQYYYLDLVYYQGSSYLVHTQPTIGTAPTDTDYWYLVAEGTEIEMRYDAGTEYIQWKLITDSTWNNLIQPADFTPTIVQGIGLSESDVMSQKAVTDEIAQLVGNLIKTWAVSESFTVSNPVYDVAGNISGGNITWPDGDVSTISNVVVGNFGLTSIRYNRSNGDYATITITYSASGDFQSQTVTVTEI